MGYARRCLLALVLFALLSATALPVVSDETTGIEPSSVVLPGRGETVTMNLSVIQDSVVFGATLDLGGSPSFTDILTPVDRDNTIGFSGTVPFADPDPDLSWYMDTILPDSELDNATAYDGNTIVTAGAEHSYHLFFVTVDPAGLVSVHTSWSGRANSTVANDTDWGARLYIYDNTSQAWEMLDQYDQDLETDQTLQGVPDHRPWHYINRTLTGEDKVIVMVQSLSGVDSVVVTDMMRLTATYATYPVPRMDLGGDERVEWGFGTSEATGELGRVTSFADNSSIVSLRTPIGGGHNDSASFLIPPGINVQGAYVDYVPFPTEGERQRQGYSAYAPGGAATLNLTVTDIPMLSHQQSSQVIISNAVKHNVTEQVNEGMDEAFPLVVGRDLSGNKSVAQSFRPAYDGPLTGIDVFLHTIVGDPGNLTLEVREIDTGTPTGTLLTTSIMKQSEFQTESWFHFTFNPVQVQQGKAYAIIFHALDSDLQISNGYSLGYDQNQNYPQGTSYLSNSLDGSTGWSTGLFDLAFRTYMDYDIDAMDATNLSVLGRSGTMVGDKVYINVSGFDYEDGNWSFRVDNGNLFGVTFDWTAWTKYLLFAESPAIDVGDDGTVEWQGLNVSTTQPLDITDGVQRVVDAVDWNLTYRDLFGNVFYEVPINVSSTSEGELALRNLVVYYNGSITTTDLADTLNELKDTYEADESGFVNVTINVSSKTAGTLTVTSVDILYDLPPYSLLFEDVVVPEDEVSEPLDLDTVVFDDHDNNNLVYTVVKESGDAQVQFNHSTEDTVTFWGPANWSGTAVFHVVAVDSSNLTYRTNSFNVTIAAVEDPPLIHGLEEEYVVYFGIPRDVEIVIEDNDTDLENITISTSSSRVAGDAVAGTLSFLYPFSGVDEVVEINISDGVAWSLYSINVTPEESNEPPIITLPQGFVVTLDAQGMLNLTSFANDLESDREELVWSVLSFPSDLVVTVHDGHMLQVIPVATVAGDHLVALSCTDPDENVAFGNLTVRLIEENRHPPVILRGNDALPRVIKVVVDGKAELNLALQKYWYDQEDWNKPENLRWEVESLRPSLFSVELDSNHKMTVTSFGSTGSGYFTIRLFDGDNDVSTTESVQVVVEEPKTATSSWMMFALAAVIVIVVVIGLMAASRSKGDERPKPKPKPAPVAAKKVKEPVVKPPVDEEPEEVEEPAPVEMVPGSINELLVIHESTSLITQMTGEGVEQISEEKADDLIEMSTLFAQERFEDTNVGTIKAFKFNGEEVLVGKGRSYFLVARCSGNDFDDVAHEMKRSIVNIDVNMAEKLRNWYPGQKVTPLEEELRELLQEGSG
jgi:hypothetical protein